MDARVLIKLKSGQEISGVSMSWETRLDFDADEIENMETAEWMQSTVDYTYIYVGVTVFQEEYLKLAENGATVMVGATSYTLAAKPSVHTAVTSASNAVWLIRISNYPSQLASVESITIAVSDDMVGENEVKAIVETAAPLPLPLTKGGTGGTTASAARTNLGLEIESSGRFHVDKIAWVGTQADYDDLSPDDSTIYLITG